MFHHHVIIPVLSGLLQFFYLLIVIPFMRFVNTILRNKKPPK